MADPDHPAADSLPDSLEICPLLGYASEQRRDNGPSLSPRHSSSRVTRQASSGGQISIGRPFVPAALRVPGFGGSSSMIAGFQAGGFLGSWHASSSHATRQAPSSQAQIFMGWGSAPALQVSDFGRSSSVIGGSQDGGFLGSSRASSSQGTRQASLGQAQIYMGWGSSPALEAPDFGGFLGNSRASSPRGPLPQLQVFPFPNTSPGLYFGGADSASLNYLRQERSSPLWSSNGSGPFGADGAYQMIPTADPSARQMLGFQNLHLGSYGSRGNHYAQGSNMRGGNTHVGYDLSHLSSESLLYRYEVSAGSTSASDATSYDRHVDLLLQHASLINGLDREDSFPMRGRRPMSHLGPFGRTRTRSRRAGSALRVGRARELVLQGPIHPRLAIAPDWSEPLLSLLDDGDLEITSNILHGVLPSVYGIMKNQYGSHLFQKLLDVCSLEQKNFVFAMTTSDPLGLVEVARDKHGIFCVKKLITAAKPWDPLCSAVTRALTGCAVDIMTDPVASHLVKHCFCNLSHEHNKFLIEAAIKYCDLLAKDQQGVFSLQQCTTNSFGPLRQLILDEIVNNTLDLACHHYGNYAVQSVLELKDQYTTEIICTIVAEHLETMSFDKYGTYVIEKCLQSSAGEYLIQKLVKFDGQQLEQIVQDQYGNYVLTTALNVTKGMRMHQQLATAITEQTSGNLESNMYAKNVLKCINQHQPGMFFLQED